MFFSFVDELRSAGIPASMKEHLTLLEAMDADIIGASPEEFYFLARATFVKDEGLLDRFDQVFGKVFKGIETDYGTEAVPIRTSLKVGSSSPVIAFFISSVTL